MVRIEEMPRKNVGYRFEKEKEEFYSIDLLIASVEKKNSLIVTDSLDIYTFENNLLDSEI